MAGIASRICATKLTCRLFIAFSWLILMSSASVLPQHPRHERAAAEGEPANYEPTNEPESKSEIKPEPNTTVEPEPEPEAESWPEPGPLWAKAFKTWKSAWEIHVYLFATCYLIMGFYAAYYVVFNLYDGLGNKYLSVSLNIMVLLFCLTRAFVMYLDPYHQGDIIKALQLMRIIWSIGGPCLTASDSLIILALLETSRLRITVPALQKAKVIAVIVAVHFIFVILTDFVVSLYVSAKGMILFCQVFYVVWGLVLGTGYIRLGYLLDKQLFGHKPQKDKQDKLYVFLIHASGVANYFLVVIMVYTMFGVFGVYSDVKFVDAWSWWALQTVLRISEVVTCILIFTVSAKRTRIKKAIDDIATIDNKVPQITTSPTTRSEMRKMRKMFRKAKRINVEPQPEPGESLSTRPVIGRQRKMSMFTHLDTESKAVKGLFLYQTQDSSTGSIDTLQEAFDSEESLDPNDNQLTSTPPKRTSKKHNKNQGIDNILEEMDVDDDDEEEKKPSFVRKISAQVRRKISGLSVLSTSNGDGKSIIQSNSNLSESFNGVQNFGFCDNPLPNTPS